MFSTFVGLGRFINCQRPEHMLWLYSIILRWNLEIICAFLNDFVVQFQSVIQTVVNDFAHHEPCI